MRHKILWVEDGAFVEVPFFTGPIFTSAKYDLDVTLDVSEAVKKIKEITFDVIIVDIRIPPGFDEEWDNLFSKAGYNKIGARLGIQLLFSLLKPEKSIIKMKNIPPWVSPEKFGIFSVESEQEVKQELKELGIHSFQQKVTNMPKTILLEFIEKIIANSNQKSIRGGKYVYGTN